MLTLSTMAGDVLRKSLRGVLGFPVTPFRNDLSLDLDALGRNVDEMAGHPFCALVAAGGAGEIYSLDVNEIAEVVRVTVDAARGRMPVLAGVGFNMAIAGDLARRAEQTGARCLLVLPPAYSNAAEAGLFDYYAAVAGASGLPLMIYSREWVAPGPAAVARLAARLPSLIAWKDGQGDMRRLQRIMHMVGDRLAWVGGVGDDCVPGYFAIGVECYTSSLSNVAPRLSLELARAGLAHDTARLDRLMRTYVHPLFAIRERVRGYEVAVTKAAMELLGRRAGPVRPPLVPLAAADLEDLRRVLEVYRDFEEEREPGIKAERSA